MPEEVDGQAPATVKVTVGGQEFEVPAELATAYRSEKDRIATEYGARLQQVQQYESGLAAREAALNEQARATVDDGTPHAPDPKDLELNPEKYARENQSWTEYLIAAKAQEYENRRQAEQQAMAQETQRAANWTRWVTQFYRDHDDLVGEEDIVDSQWRKHFAAIRNMNSQNGEASNFLAEKTKERILQLSERGKTRRAPRLEHSGGSPSFEQQVSEPEEPERFGLGKIIKAKQARSRAAAYGG